MGNDPVDFVFGDDLSQYHALSSSTPALTGRRRGATTFGDYVHDPERYSDAEFDDQLKVISLEEKKAQPPSNYAIIKLYFIDNQVNDIAASLKSAPHRELTITDVNRIDPERRQLQVEVMGQR